MKDIIKKLLDCLCYNEWFLDYYFVIIYMWVYDRKKKIEYIVKRLKCKIFFFMR